MASQKHLTFLEKQFRELSVEKQKIFLSHLYELSKENTDIFEIWLNNGEKTVFLRLQKEIDKETLNRIGRSRKLRVSKLNEIAKKAEKYPLSTLLVLDVYEYMWQSILLFILQTGYVPNTYREVCVRYIAEYLHRIKSIAEPQERHERTEKCQKMIWKTIKKQYYFPHLQDLYLEFFGGKPPQE